ncbi:MAG: AbrB/MazE/SpoVT family DNA-binding domain-containing protein [Gammaproteobacteria bacterium]|nr:AbrB/MazE/SpoVT family DNA-binding domain-containing protein [Gammaproteobacteria bacterium]
MKTGTIFQHNSSQIVSLPVETHFPETVKKVYVRVVGQDRILTPVVHTWDSFFLRGAAVTEDFITEPATQEQQKREAF